MKKSKKLNDSQSSLSIAYFFALFVGALIVVSIFIKGAFLLKSSNFDGQHRFTLAVFLKDPSVQSKNKTIIYSFAPDTRTLSALGLSQDIPGDTISLSRFLEVPIDSSITITNLNSLKLSSIFDEVTANNIEPAIFSLLKHSLTLNSPVTVIDLIRIYFYTYTVPVHAVSVRNIAVSKDMYTSDRVHSLDKIYFQLFSDTTLTGEKISIQVINSTKVSGLGNRLAQMLTNVGGNVVSVTTADSRLEKSEIAYYGDETYTVQKLAKILRFSVRKLQKPGISDIMVTIGNDMIESSVF